MARSKAPLKPKKFSWGSVTRYVATSGGATYFGQDIGEVIIRDINPRFLRFTKLSYNGQKPKGRNQVAPDDMLVATPTGEFLKGHENDRFYIGKYDDGPGFYVQTQDMLGTTDRVLIDNRDSTDDETSLQEVIAKLDHLYGQEVTQGNKTKRRKTSTSLDHHRVMASPRTLKVLQQLRAVNPRDKDKFKEAADKARTQLFRIGVKPSGSTGPAFKRWALGLLAKAEESELNLSPRGYTGKDPLEGFHRASPAELEELKKGQGRDDVLSDRLAVHQVYVRDDPDDDIRAKYWHPRNQNSDEDWKWDSLYTDAHWRAADQKKYKRARAIAKLVVQQAWVDQLSRQMTSAKNPKDRETAAVLALITVFGIRVGSEDAKTQGEKTFGATTLERQHIKIVGNNVTLSFRGKSGKDIVQTRTDPELAKALKKFMYGKKPNEQLFPGARDDTCREYLNRILKPQIKDLPASDNLKVHDLRTVYANKVAAQVVQSIRDARKKEGLPPKTEDPKELDQYRTYIAFKVGEMLSDTPRTALMSYVDPSSVDPVTDFDPNNPVTMDRRGAMPPGVPDEYWLPEGERTPRNAKRRQTAQQKSLVFGDDPSAISVEDRISMLRLLQDIDPVVWLSIARASLLVTDRSK